MTLLIHPRVLDARLLGIALPPAQCPLLVLGIDPGGSEPTGLALLRIDTPADVRAVSWEGKFARPMPVSVRGERTGRQGLFRSVQELADSFEGELEHVADDLLRMDDADYRVHMACEAMYAAPQHAISGLHLAELAGQLRQELGSRFQVRSDAQYKACRDKFAWRQLLGAERKRAAEAQAIAVGRCEDWFGGDWQTRPHAAEAACIALWRARQLSRSWGAEDLPAELSARPRRRKGALPQAVQEAMDR